MRGELCQIMKAVGLTHISVENSADELRALKQRVLFQMFFSLYMFYNRNQLQMLEARASTGLCNKVSRRCEDRARALEARFLLASLLARRLRVDSVVGARGRCSSPTIFWHRRISDFDHFSLAGRLQISSAACRPVVQSCHVL